MRCLGFAKGVCFASLILLVSARARGAEVLQFAKDFSYVLVALDTAAPFNVGDRVCVLEGTQDVACGPITDRKARHALAKLEFHHTDFKVGAPVRSVASVTTAEVLPTPVEITAPPPATPAATHEPVAAQPSPRDPESELSAVAGIQLNLPDSAPRGEALPNSAPVLSNGQPVNSKSSDWTRIELIQYHRELIHQQDEYSDDDEIQFNLTD